MSGNEIIITGDGSHTLYDAATGDHYHSSFGAVTESEHIFIRAGLEKAFDDFGGTIRLLEAGFGTGLNALLSLKSAHKKVRKVLYHAVEAYPVSASVAGTMNYPERSGFPGACEYFRQLHECPWEYEADISEFFSLKKINARIELFEPCGPYHLCYFDAFAPDRQPELWTAAIFAKIYRELVPGGILLTYSVKGDVKRALKQCGFILEKLPGPPGKREFLRGRKSASLNGE